MSFKIFITGARLLREVAENIGIEAKTEFYNLLSSFKKYLRRDHSVNMIIS